MINLIKMTEYPTITQGFEETGKQIRDTIPHIIIGKDKPVQQAPPEIPPKKELKKREYFTPINDVPGFDPNKAKRWALFICVLAVLGYAGYRLINVLL